MGRHSDTEVPFFSESTEHTWHFALETARKRKPYTDRGIRKIIVRYAKAAGLEHKVSPHKLRHFLLTWLKKQGIDDALIQPYSGTRKSLEVYSFLAIGEVQEAYDEVISRYDATGLLCPS